MLSCSITTIKLQSYCSVGFVIRRSDGTILHWFQIVVLFGKNNFLMEKNEAVALYNKKAYIRQSLIV